MRSPWRAAPFRGRSASVYISSYRPSRPRLRQSLELHQHVPAHLVGDRRELDLVCVACEHRDRVLVADPVATEDLRPECPGVTRTLGRHELRHRGLHVIGPARFTQPRSLVREVAGVLEVDTHIRQVVLERLKARDRPTERLALLYVAHASLVDRRDHADTEHRNPDALWVQHGHDLAIRLTATADEVLLGDGDVAVADFDAVAVVTADLLH